MAPFFSWSATSISACWIAVGGGLAADGVDVARLVGDVGDVHVDQHEADLAELRLQRGLDALEEPVAVPVDLLDLHRGDDLTQLTEDDVLAPASMSPGLEAQQADGRILHDARLGADGDGEDGRHVDADVLDGQGAAQRDLDLQRLEVEVGVVLDQRDHEGAATVETLAGGLAADLSVHDQDRVGRAPLVAACEEDDEQHREDDDEDDEAHDERRQPRGQDRNHDSP
jgi:hypothetical protein